MERYEEFTGSYDWRTTDADMQRDTIAVPFLPEGTFTYVEKPSNPKDSVGIEKVPFSTVPSEVIAEIGLAMFEGARKYGRHNYREIGVRASVYYDAFMRHVTAWWEGQDIDPDSGLSHLTKAMACLVVLRDSMIIENWEDDRPPAIKKEWVQELNAKAKDIINKYPNAKSAYTNKQSGDQSINMPNSRFTPPYTTAFGSLLDPVSQDHNNNKLDREWPII